MHTNGGVKMTTSDERQEILDELFRTTLYFLRKKDPNLLDDIFRAASLSCKDVDFIMEVALRIRNIVPLLGCSSEIPDYLGKILTGLLCKSSELYCKEKFASSSAETSAYSEEA